jgi:quinoprotein glucose dehydrogenase
MPAVDMGDRMQLSGRITLGALISLLGLAGCGEKTQIDYSGPISGWLAWGGDAGGTRFSPLTQIAAGNVGQLEKAWTYHIGKLPVNGVTSPTFESTPILAEGRLYTCTGKNKVVAIDPETGKELWSYDARGNDKGSYLLNCRGVTYWKDPDPSSACPSRIFTGTIDGRLVALNAATGQPCPGFGTGGTRSLREGMGENRPGEISVSSPPVVAGNVVIVGTRIPDNMRIDEPAGVVRAFDVHSGKLVWAWNPLPPGRSDAEMAGTSEPYVRATPNVWAPMSVDPARNLVFLPTGNAAPDHFAADRRGRDYYASSVVALDTRTGKVRWFFQTVHHDVWDYDVPSQPVLFDLPTANGKVAALAQATKQGHIFILDRETGKPLFPVEERPVPQNGLPGEKLSPTQPFPVNKAFIIRRDLSEKDMWGFTPWDKGKCVDLFRSARWEGIFTPPTTRGTIFYPSFMGTSNWGGISIDPVNGVLVANTTHVPAIVRMIPRKEADARLAKGERFLPMIGGPYGNTMEPMLSPFGAPCVRPPWGTLLTIDLKTGKRLWEVPLGTTRDMAPFPMWMKLGVPNMGGSVITASGLVFIAATTDNFLRAFDRKTGKELWKGRLPAGGQATPMTYRMRKNGKQYVVIAAGGHKYLGTTLGDSLVAFALPN